MVKKSFFQKLDKGGYITILFTATVALLFLVLCLTPRDNSVTAKPIIHTETTTRAKATESTPRKRYELTEAERWEVASVVTAEAGGEPFEGKVAVAQCILQACEDDGIRPSEALIKYQYSGARPEPYDEALEAVEAVFDDGQVATSEPIKYFYAPALVYSEWHESQVYVMTINNHRFFAERG